MPLPPREGNPNFPLPPEYNEMHSDDQREARVRLCRSYFDPKRPTLLISDPEAFYWAFRFWKSWYRKRLPRNAVKYAYPDAPYHQRWIRSISKHRRSVIGAFRDSGKSFVLCEELPEFLISTRPNTPVQYVSSVSDLTEKQVRAVLLDIEQNELIRADFGELKPPRGSKLLWKAGNFECLNGSSLKGISAYSHARGSTQQSLRPLAIFLDDWEADKRLENPELRDDADSWLFDVLLPMGEPGCWIVWTNTLLSIQALAMKAIDHVDPRFDSWHTERVDIDYFEEIPQPDGSMAKVRRSSWPSRFPVKDLEAMEGTGNERVVGLGRHAFEKEFRNRPGSKSGRAFEYDPLRHSFHWRLDTTANKKYLVDTETGAELDYDELKERSIGAVGTDLALGKAWGDYSAVTAARLDDTGCLWVLEPWQARVKPMEALYHAILMAEFWGCIAIAVERVNFEQMAIDQLEEELTQRKLRNEFAPEVYVCNRAGAETKFIRTMRLGYRFRENKIKIVIPGPHPCHYATHAKDLEEQILLFTQTGGALRFDDLLDTLVATQETFQAVGRVAFSPRRQETVIEQMRAARKAGVILWPGTQGLDAREVAQEMMREKREKELKDPDLCDLALGFAADWADDAGSVFNFNEAF